ncbi:MAG: Na+-transporting NADH:ubiquinone oxidoreductase subunit NqrC [Oceanicoccus sp.]|jgi:Na+-transporting NADH:ubiquinone oxidoreductase subunit NqrC
MKTFFITTLILFSSISLAQKGQYLSPSDFQARYFDVDAQSQTLWINKTLRTDVEAILNHRFTALRMRYWGKENRTGWILEEIGKELPITVGVVIDGDEIFDVSILEYRESRGGEIRYPFFTRQFQQAGLSDKGRYGLDKTIDGITGATLSVRALKKIATLALFLHRQTPFYLQTEKDQGS